MLNSLTRTNFWAALAIGAVFLGGETAAQAQQLRSPNNGSGRASLPAAVAPALLNNGSLQTTQNPQGGFSYTATMLLGDRLGNNGVFYNSNLLPNAGLYQGGQFIGQMNNNNNNYSGYGGAAYGSGYGFPGGLGFSGIASTYSSFGSDFGGASFAGGGWPAQQQYGFMQQNALQQQYLYLLLLQQQYMVQQLQQQQLQQQLQQQNPAGR
jgi:hypothetical protein